MTTPLLEREHVHAPEKRKSRTPWLVFGVAGIVGLFVVRALTSHTTIPLSDQAQDFLTLTISVIIESMPFVVLGIVLSIAVQVWIFRMTCSCGSCRGTPSCAGWQSPFSAFCSRSVSAATSRWREDSSSRASRSPNR